MATNAPNMGQKVGGRPASRGRLLPQGALVETQAGGGLAARTPQLLASITKGGKSTTNSQPVSGA